LVELARGFFHYWGEEFDSRQHVVSIANGAPFARERPFGQPVAANQQSENQGEEKDGVEKAERVRQEMEDLALEAFADEQQKVQQEEGGGEGAAQTDDAHAELDAIAQAQSELDEEREKANQTRSRANSRSSSPIPYGDFSEPEKWTEHLLVVQDPFILTRNCAGNVRPDWVEELRIVSSLFSVSSEHAGLILFRFPLAANEKGSRSHRQESTSLRNLPSPLLGSRIPSHRVREATSEDRRAKETTRKSDAKEIGITISGQEGGGREDKSERGTREVGGGKRRRG